VTQENASKALAALEDLLEKTRELRQALRDAIQSLPRAGSIQQPFHPLHRPASGDTPTKSQRIAMRWRDRLQSRNAALRDYFLFSGGERKLRLFPLAGYGELPNFGYGLTAEDCLKALEREWLLLEGEIAKREAAEAPAEPSLQQRSVVPPPVEKPEPLLTARQAAERLGLPLQRVYELARRNLLPVVRFGRQVRFHAGVLRDPSEGKIE
jgi:excisionase family DNA binding protein